MALRQSGLRIDREVPLTVQFRGRVVGRFRADLVVGGTVLVEVKACSHLESIHHAQVLNYLRATVLEVGLLLNFWPSSTVQAVAIDNHHKYCHRIRGPNGCAGRPMTDPC